MKNTIIFFVLAFLLTSCMSADYYAAQADSQRSTATAQVIGATATIEAERIMRTTTAEAQRLEAARVDMRRTDQAIEATATAGVQQTAVAQATAAAAQITAEYNQAETATAEAQSQATAQAHVIETQRAWVQTQAAQEAQGTATAIGMAFLIADKTATAQAQATGTQRAWVQTQTVVTAEQAALERSRMDADKLRSLGIVRAERTNLLLAGAPYVAGSLVLVLLIWLGWRFGLAESNRRKQQPDGTIIDERGGSLTVLIPNRSLWPQLENTAQGAVTQEVSEGAQSVVAGQAQLVEALRALAAAGTAPTLPQMREMMLGDQRPLSRSGPRPLFRIVNSLPAEIGDQAAVEAIDADWSEANAEQ